MTILAGAPPWSNHAAGHQLGEKVRPLRLIPNTRSNDSSSASRMSARTVGATTGVVHEYVHPAELVVGGRHQAFPIGGHRHVGSHRHRPYARLPTSETTAAAASTLLTLVHHDVVAGTGQRQRDPPPDPARRAGDQGYPCRGHTRHRRSVVRLVLWPPVAGTARPLWRGSRPTCWTLHWDALTRGDVIQPLGR